MLIEIFLPLSLAFIMFSLGLGLTPGDFTRVARMPTAFAIGAIAQVVVLPLVAFALLPLFRVQPELAVGVMILACAPGGVTSNVITKLAGEAVALSVSLTAVVSLLSVVTVPMLVAFSVWFFMGEDAPEVDVTSLAVTMFMLTAVPVGLGVAMRAFATSFAIRFEVIAGRIAAVLFVLIVIGAVAANWALFITYLPVLGPLLVLLNILMLAIGYALALAGGLDVRERITVAIEAGVQNSTVGITVGAIVGAGAAGAALGPFSLAAGVYGITMYFVAVPVLLWMRRK
ncbi:bile acid:Na+ symporter, BASS family [Monaibacterium marinum]|uniref:Bile acid:Na+ symporter, BASS family n=1 Tax=Pontivivens marinum TaxID=1690039 RepID=A0A2C9CN54_9RHOB|nr:bile acid:sodium symporter family protein [Monaibacterium marinum]SOH92662.1 bile acid:Na+ symporter, BASS family [Monaibacterium marinum]